MLNFLVQDDALNLAVWIRSNDIMKAWPMNAIALRTIQRNVARELGLRLGVLITNSMSAHIYEQDFETARSVLKHRSFNPLTFDPRGNIVVSVSGQSIQAAHTDTHGIVLKTYSSLAPARLMRELAQDGAISSVAHALDIGAEIQKAHVAIKNNIPYVQDHELIFNKT